MSSNVSFVDNDYFLRLNNVENQADRKITEIKLRWTWSLLKMVNIQ